jgi:FkbM family methyltransferase
MFVGWSPEATTLDDNSAFEVPFVTKRYRGHTCSYIDWHVYYYGAYERQELEFLASILKRRRNSVVLDIGANVGHHTLYLSQFASHVHAFEPYPIVRNELVVRLSDNSVSNVTVHPVGLGDRTETLPFFRPKLTNTGSGSFVQSHDSTNIEGDKLPIVRGDEFISSLNLSNVDLIKIDVEGLEKEVLSGLADTLRRYRPVVVFELSSTSAHTLASEKGLMSLFPDQYLPLLLSANEPRLLFFNRSQIQLKPFHLKTSNVLLMPIDRMSDDIAPAYLE